MYNVKNSIKEFVSYKPNTIEYEVKLDANESRRNESLIINQLSVNSLNRYPDHYTVTLREKLGDMYNVKKENVIVGSGSSELLELVVKTFVNPGEIVLSIKPSFVMYKKYTLLSGGVYKEVDTNDNYELDVNLFIQKAKELNPKVIFLCTPNNPTGVIMKQEDVRRIIESVDCLIVVDEAYMEFSEENQSVTKYIDTYPNLIVNRTFSKAYAIAGARLGYFIANEKLIDTLFIAKTPYSVTDFSQQIGLLVLSDKTYLKNNISEVIQERNKLNEVLTKMGIKTFQSSTNFIFCKYETLDLKAELEKRKILIRGFNNGTYRITVGTKKENVQLIKALEEIL